jgi:3-deoxy-D-manno-octulosonate 8-phosphate phosphatase (KDO 8-P phosphatase)
MNYLASNLKVLLKEAADKAAFIQRFKIDPEQIPEGSYSLDVEVLRAMAGYLNLSIDRLLGADLAVQAGMRTPAIALLALDIDGVLTDAGMYYTQSGDEFKKFNAKDGLAIKTLTSSGLPVAFISSGINDRIIRDRAELLGVKLVYVGTWKKLEILEKWCSELGIGLDQVAYIGDDINDMPVIEKVGLSACPGDAVRRIRDKVHVVLEKPGGGGCVREFADLYLKEI